MKIKDVNWECFKSSECHRLKRLGDLAYIQEVIQKEEIQEYWNDGIAPCSLYLLAMIDYLSKENNLPLDPQFDFYRKQSLKNWLIPLGIWTIWICTHDEEWIKESLQKAIPEFKKYKIIEGDIRNVA